jgi:hypothetical protein
VPNSFHAARSEFGSQFPKTSLARIVVIKAKAIVPIDANHAKNAES